VDRRCSRRSPSKHRYSPPPPHPHETSTPTTQIAHYANLILRHISIPVVPGTEVFADGIPRAATLGPYKAAEVRGCDACVMLARVICVCHICVDPAVLHL
jgi:hypothetical protein